MKKKVKYITLCIAGCLLVGYLCQIVILGSMDGWYRELDKPGFLIPDRWFTPIWAMLFVLSGISAGLVWAKGHHHIWVKTALYHFVFQLLFNALWALVFFGLQRPFAGLVVMLILLTLVFLTIKWFRIISRTAALLLVPYSLWVGYLAVANYSIWALNP